MKAKYRCKAHAKGDRCTRARGHELNTEIAEVERLHISNHLVWRDGQPPMPLVTPMRHIDRFTKLMDQQLNRADNFERHRLDGQAKFLRKQVIEAYEKSGFKI